MLSFIRVIFLLILMCLLFDHGLSAAETLSFQDSLEGCQQGDFDKTKRLVDLSRDTVNYYMWYVNENCANTIYNILESDRTINNLDVTPIVHRFPNARHTVYWKERIFKGEFPFFGDAISMDDYLRSLIKLLKLETGTYEHNHVINIVSSHSNFGKGQDALPIYPNDFSIDPDLYRSFQDIKDLHIIDFCKLNACPQKLGKDDCTMIRDGYYSSLKYFYLADIEYFKDVFNNCIDEDYFRAIFLRALGIFDRRCSFELQYYLLREHNNYDLSNCGDYIEKIYDGYLDRNYDGYFILRNYASYKDSKLFEYISKLDKNLDETIEYFHLR